LPTAQPSIVPSVQSSIHSTVFHSSNSTIGVGEPLVSVTGSPLSMSQFFPFVFADSTRKRTEMAHHQFHPGPGADALDIAIELAHPSRKERYRQCVANYRRFVGRKKIAWQGEPRRGMWLASGLLVRVNPELRLGINGKPYVVKLYLKADDKAALSQRTANPILHLLDECHGDLGEPMVFDLVRGRAFTRTRANHDFEPMLRAQAAAFVSLWQNVSVQPAAPSAA